MYMTTLLTIVLFVAVAQCAPKLSKSKDSNDVRSYFQKLEQKNASLNSACAECKLIVSELKNVIKDPSKLDRLKVVLKLLCDYIGGSQAQECKNMVDNIDFVIHELEPYMDDPEKFCQELHLCGSHKFSTCGHIALKSMKFVVRNSNNNKTSNDLLCDECVFAATEFNNMIHSQDVQQEIKKELEQICKVWAKYEQKCNEAIEQYFPSLIQFMESIISDPKAFCAKVQMCPRTNGSMVQHSAGLVSHSLQLRRASYNGPLRRTLLSVPLLQTRRGHNVMCVMCQYGFKSLINEVKKNNQAISKGIGESVCNLLPETLEADCLDFASIYASSLLKMLTNEWTPDQICNQMQVCTNETLTSLKEMNEADRSNTVCEACHAFTEFISYEFRQQALQQQVTAIIKEQICNILPGDLSNQCLDTADQYVPMIMQRIADYVTSATFCQELHMCPLTGIDNDLN